MNCSYKVRTTPTSSHACGRPALIEVAVRRLDIKHPGTRRRAYCINHAPAAMLDLAHVDEGASTK